MTLKQALYLKTIAQCGGITAAAKTLYVSQPSLSQMLRQLEEELGLSIFDRSVSPFRVTYAGEKCLEAAEAILSANAQLENQLREIRQDRSGRLRLGISVQRALQVLPPVLPVFSRQYPNVQLEVTESGSASLEELLRRGEIDLALAAAAATGSDLHYTLIEKETMGLLAGKDSRLANRMAPGEAVALEDAAGDPFVSLRKGHSLRVVQESLFRAAGFAPRILLETDNLEVGKRVALNAGGCMLLSDIYADDYVRLCGGKFYPLRDYENNRHFYACCRKGEFIPQYTLDFIRITEEVLEQQRGEEPVCL